MKKEEILEKIEPSKKKQLSSEFIIEKLDNMNLDELDSIKGLNPDEFYSILLMRMSSNLSLDKCHELHTSYIESIYTMSKFMSYIIVRATIERFVYNGHDKDMMDTIFDKLKNSNHMKLLMTFYTIWNPDYIKYVVDNYFDYQFVKDDYGIM